MSESHTVNVPADTAERVRQELVKRLGLDPGQIMDGTLTMEWDVDGARVMWSGVVALNDTEAASIFEAAFREGVEWRP